MDFLQPSLSRATECQTPSLASLSLPESDPNMPDLDEVNEEDTDALL